jgi:hypothetical protein
VLDKVRATATKINAAFVWDILPEEENAGLGVTAADVNVAAGADATLTASATNAVGTVAYTWYKSDASGNKQGAALGTGATLTVKSADLVTGANYFLVEVTDRTGDTASKKVTVAVDVAAPGKSITPTGVKLYNSDGTVLEEDKSFGQTGVYKLPADGSIVVVGNTPFTANQNYFFNNKVYLTNSSGRIEIPVSDLETKTTINANEFTKVHEVHVANGITLQTHAKLHVINSKNYVEDGTTDLKVNLPTGVTKCIVVDSADEVQDLVTNGKDGNDSLTISKETWIKGAATVTLANGGGTNPTVEVDEQGTALVTSGDYVAIGTTLYVTASATGETVTASGANVVPTDLTEVADTDPQEYTYVMTGNNLTLTDSST